MTSQTLQNALEQNRKNLKALLDALDADYELAEDPETKAILGAYFGDSIERVKQAEMTDEERAAWLFEQNAEAIAAAADAAGASQVERSGLGGSDPLAEVAESLGGNR